MELDNLPFKKYINWNHSSEWLEVVKATEAAPSKRLYLTNDQLFKPHKHNEDGQSGKTR